MFVCMYHVCARGGGGGVDFVSRMLTYANVCWRMLTYADATLCAGEDELSRMREAQVSAMAHFVALSAPADVCSRMLTYAHIRV